MARARRARSAPHRPERPGAGLRWNIAGRSYRRGDRRRQGASAPALRSNLDHLGGGFDLSTFAEGAGKAFNGGIAIRSGEGNLQLISGDDLKAANVQLVADGGLVDSAGTIDVSGVNGGNVNLYGAQGVLLRAGSLIDAHADGYGAADTRQASGGNVTLGVDGDGVIDVAQGAVIDVAALNTGNRLVPMDRTSGAYYTYVAGDLGGTVTFRAPVISQGGADTVAVSSAKAPSSAPSASFWKDTGNSTLARWPPTATTWASRW